MADSVSGIKPVTTTYPVKPTQPTQRDRETDSQRKKRRQPDDDKRNPDEHDSDGKPTIDEHV